MNINWPDEYTKALIASRVFGLHVEYRMCMLDYEGGGWEEGQSMYGPDEQARWLKNATEWNMPAEYDDRTEAGMIREACVSDRHEVKLCYLDDSSWKLVPDYPNDIAAAWQVIDWMIERGWEISLEGSKGDKWWIHVADPSYVQVMTDGEWRRPLAWSGASTVARVICKAALEALEKPENPW